MCIALGHHKPDDVRLVRWLAMGRPLQLLPWCIVRGHTSPQSRLVDDIQYRCVSLVLQESARRVEAELGLVEYVHVSESVVVGEFAPYELSV